MHFEPIENVCDASHRPHGAKKSIDFRFKNRTRQYNATALRRNRDCVRVAYDAPNPGTNPLGQHTSVRLNKRSLDSCRHALSAIRHVSRCLIALRDKIVPRSDRLVANAGPPALASVRIEKIHKGCPGGKTPDYGSHTHSLSFSALIKPMPSTRKDADSTVSVTVFSIVIELQGRPATLRCEASGRELQPPRFKVLQETLRLFAL